ncbi:unnamed protein product [Spirodela intermedia]|uniref:Uncharacterized protein n=1 Tax=Spirodela intermedia TaxID=51605 RepID=A0A7I8KLN6_SPIIN|nr:unnamed protein product [Spirodela intermedia]
MGGEVKVKSYCDACRGSPGLLFCRVHAAFLCAACDGHLHGGAARHERVWVCEICERAPAVVTCKADAAALCAACDSDVHSASTLSRRHQRFPVTPFSEPLPGDWSSHGTASKNSYNHSQEMLRTTPELKAADSYYYYHHVSEGDPYFALEEAPAVDGVVPVQSDGRKVVAAAQPLVFAADDGFIDMDSGGPKPLYGGDAATPSAEEIEAVETSEDGGGWAAPLVAGAVDREARVMRYREKRRNRRFEKIIRYASRKAYAESRHRVKGRFVKDGI